MPRRLGVVLTLIASLVTVARPVDANRGAALASGVRSGEHVHWVPGGVQRLIRSLALELDVAAAAEIAQVVHSECANRTIDPLYAISVMKVESNFRADAVSPRGAVGLLQVQPITARAVARAEGKVGRSLRDPRTNVAIGLEYLERLEREFPNRATALAAYNIGPTKVRSWLAKQKPISRAYADRVLATYSAYRARGG